MRPYTWMCRLIVGGLFVSSSLFAQTGRISVRVTDQASGDPIAGAEIAIEGSSGQMTPAGTTQSDGTYSAAASPGSYAVFISAIGYQARRVTGVTVSAGGTTTVDAVLVGLTIALDPVVITASRRQEKAIEAPASVSVIPTVEIIERPALTVTDHLKSLPGVDISQGGLVQSNVVGRGFNNIFSGALLTITDNRFASVPSLRVNVPVFYPGVNDDIERIEFVLGPGAALYGPNASNGVLSIITKSPLTSQGTTVFFESGFRAGSRGVTGASLDDPQAIVRGGLRHAGAVGDKFGYKISGEYLTGREWQSNDPAEPRTLTGQNCNPETGCRNFDLTKWALDARFDIRPSPESEIIASFGRTKAVDLIEYTGIGAAQGKNWHYDYAQVRARWKRLFVQAFQNRSNSGNSDLMVPPEGSFLLRDGNPVVDNSRVTAGQIQHGFLVGSRQDFIYGIDYAYTDARTQMTINGRNEIDDDIREIGGYIHSSTQLADQLELVAAIRVDDHSRLEDPVFSPRAALVVKPAPSHSIRFTYNRAFSTPSNNNLFLDIIANQAGPFNVRALGVPKEGFNFREGHCAAGGIDDLCMRLAPLAPGLPGDVLPAISVVPLAPGFTGWDIAVGAVLQSPQLAPLAPFFAGIPDPTPAQVGTQLRRLDATAGVWRDIAPSTVRDIGRMRPTITNALEIGYKGIIDDRFRLSVDGWFQRKEDFVGPLIIESPNVFLELSSTLAYLQATLQPALVAFAGQSPEQAAATTQAVAVAMAGVSGGSPATGMTGVPLGTIVPNSPLTDKPDIFLTYRNFGDVDLFGADVAFDYLFNDMWSIAGSFSVTSDDYFAAADVGGPTDIALNASKAKGSFTTRYRNIESGWSGEVRGRYVKGFPVNSGVYVSPTRPDGTLQPLDSYGLVDAQVVWRPTFANGFVVSLIVENILNERYATFIGVPQLGRLVMSKLQYSF